jgi:Pyruvate/2-oxoacid:ferredoxin oxidoreductase delta subunit
MSDKPYYKLREFLDTFPLGFPQTASGVEIKILKKLFSHQEAELAVLLSPVPEEAAQIAQRTGLNQDNLNEKLEFMSQNGLIFRLRRKGKTYYNAAPFMIGLYEYSVKKIDDELAGLFKEYYDIAYQKEMGASNIPGFKVIPVEETIATDMVLLPYHKIKEDIRAARKIAVADCVCRKEARLTGSGCDAPLETCLSFGVAAEYYIENGLGREITADEAITIIEKADHAGLVHAGANAKHLSNICNCCPCCCASLKGITQSGHTRHKFMNALFEARIDAADCTACEQCLDRCPAGALSVDDVAIVDIDKCLGCGLCAGTCPTEAIRLHLREDRKEPYDRAFDLYKAIVEKKRNQEKIRP